MNLRIPYAALLIFAAATACTTDGSDGTGGGADGSASGGIEASIGAYRIPDTRTTLDPDGRTTRWSEDDRIAVWARDETGFAFEAQPFALRTYTSEYSAARFSATLPQMEPGIYTYCAVYPLPAQHDGTNVTYALPAVQSGNYDGASDIMVATPATGPTLTKIPDERTTLAFRHLCHALRIEIPAGRNRLGEPVKRLEITFPAPVAGTLTFDAASPDAAPVLTDGTSTVVLDFPGDGFTGTDGSYAWVFIAPTVIDGPIAFRAYNGAGFQAAAIETTLQRVLEAGHTTPIALTVPEARPVTRLDFRVAENRLGEALTQIRLTSDSGLFVAPFRSENANEATAVPEGDGIFRTYVYADEFTASALQGLRLGIDYESENALLQGHSIGLPAAIAEGADVQVPMTVPYLYEERFDGVVGFNYYDDKGSGSSASNPDAIELTDKGLPGWTGSRIGGSAGHAVRVCCHYEGAGFAYGRYDGRIDSAPMRGLKEGRTVKVRVSYDYDGGTTQAGKDTAPVYAYGYTTQQGGFKGDSNLETQVAGGIVLSKNNGYGNIALNNSYEIAGCTAQHRLSWKVSNNRSGWTSYFGDYFLYLDNIKVQIVP